MLRGLVGVLEAGTACPCEGKQYQSREQLLHHVQKLASEDESRPVQSPASRCAPKRTENKFPFLHLPNVVHLFSVASYPYQTAKAAISEKNESDQTFDQCLRSRETRKPETVTPEHPDVVIWEVRQAHLKSLSPTQRAKYVAESPELWEMFSEEPPRMTRTNRGDRVRYDQPEQR